MWFITGQRRFWVKQKGFGWPNAELNPVPKAFRPSAPALLQINLAEAVGLLNNRWK